MRWIATALAAVAVVGLIAVLAISENVPEQRDVAGRLAPPVPALNATLAQVYEDAAAACREAGVRVIARELEVPTNAVDAAKAYTAWPGHQGRYGQPIFEGCLAGFETAAQAVPPSELPEVMGPTHLRSGISQVQARVTGRVVGRAFHYFVWSRDQKGLLAHGGMTQLLDLFGFARRGRPVVMRLLDYDGRSAWAAGYDGRRAWVRVRPELAGCGPVWLRREDGKLRRLDRSSRTPCRVKPLERTVVVLGSR